jgi:DNA-directed RNA polymerase specialized sigma24 family protein
VTRWFAARRATRDRRLAELVRPLYAAALRLTEDPVSAEDLVVRAHRALDGGARDARRAGVPDLGLLAAVYSAHREAHGPPIRPDDVRRALDASAMDAARPGRSLGELAAALDRLPPALWHPLWLRDNRGLSYDEIALVLGLPPADVARLVSCARRRVVAELRTPTPGVATEGRLRRAAEWATRTSGAG